MASTKVLHGITAVRSNREPMDNDFLRYSYNDLLTYLSLETSSFYGGLITSVINDDNNAYNGPWYISYTINDDKSITYSATRISLQSETDSNLYLLLDRPKYTVPDITIQFYSGTTNTWTAKKDGDVYEDIEIGSYFLPGFLTTWNEKTSSYTSGTLSSFSQSDTSVNLIELGNDYLGVSYGLSSGSFTDVYGTTYSSVNINNVSYGGSICYIGGEESYSIISDISISYLYPSYMFYPQLYEAGTYEISTGTGATAWFEGGAATLNSSNYIVTGKYRYYWGFADSVPTSKEELQSFGNSGLLNSTSVDEGTLTSVIIGKNGSEKTTFYVAFPIIYDIVAFSSSIKISCLLPNGLEYDLISDDQNMSLKLLNITLGSDDYECQYGIAWIDFKVPIGVQNAIVSFRIIPSDVDNEYVYLINSESGEHLTDEDGNTTEIETTDNFTIDYNIIN